MLVIIEILIAFPVGCWGMHYWLRGFEYRIHISWWIFFLAGSIAAIIAIATISFQTLKAAFANPSKSIMTE